MFKSVRTLGIALATAATLAGCNAALPTAGVASPDQDVVGANTARGKVRVALAGNLGKVYKTLATRADVHKLKLVLTSHPRGKAQVRELGPKELAKPMIYIDFDRVAAGKATLAVSAFDAQGRAIGKGENRAAVKAGKTSTLHVKVKLDPNAGEGNVDAVITFEETDTVDPTPRDGEEAFRKADQDGDGWLTLKEYTHGWPHAWGGGVISFPASPAPTPTARPMPSGTPAVGGIAGSKLAVAGDAAAPAVMPCYAGPEPLEGRRIAYPCKPPVDPARQEFRRRDADRDGRLSLAEFLGRVPAPWCDSRFIDLDGDGDDRLSFNEWSVGEPVPVLASGMPEGQSAPVRPVEDWLYVRFKKMDVNGDGLLDRDELCNAEGGPIIAY